MIGYAIRNGEKESGNPEALDESGIKVRRDAW
jgi:hypothetical protein